MKQENRPMTPDVVFGQLFLAIQSSGIFPDSKTFADAKPKYPAKLILEKYNAKLQTAGFDLKGFITEHFDFSEGDAIPVVKENTVEEHIKKLWPLLSKEPDDPITGDSLLPLPFPYIIPGGRFKEIYYWDSFFTMQGLAWHGEWAMIEHMIRNFDYLIQTYGHIPNGNRTYFLSRSQPPFFASMLNFISEVKNDPAYPFAFLDSLLKEYRFWMDAPEDLPVGESYRRVTRINETGRLNRYWDDNPIPRQESWIEDIHLSRGTDHPERLYRNIRAACESGWDFSSRWLSDPMDLSSIETSQILPVDLNVLLWLLENTIATCYKSLGDSILEHTYRTVSESRKQLIIQLFWDPVNGCFQDYHLGENKRLQRPTLAMIYPLWGSLCTRKQADQTVKYVTEHFLKPGGLATSRVESGQQWDSPNGWPPLQWLAVKGLLNYGHNRLALEIINRWLSLNDKVFVNTGKMMEKYNVEDMNLMAGGGEYPVQDGFGWTNGVYLSFIHLRNKYSL
jgi:alpha,alpha-trehalase